LPLDCKADLASAVQIGKEIGQEIFFDTSDPLYREDTHY